MKKYWYGVHNRGLDTVAVWNTFAPTFNVGSLTLAQHTTDVSLLHTHLREAVAARDDLECARAGRDTSAAQLQDLCSRACRMVLGTLPRGDTLAHEVRTVYAVRGVSQQAVVERATRLSNVWTLLNAHRASSTPALPPLVVGTMDAGTFQSALGNHGVLLQNVATKMSLFNRKNEQLRDTVTRVDANNKRWYQSWRGHFASGTTEHRALSQIPTKTSKPVPGQAVFLGVETLPGLQVRLSFDAARATSFTLLHKGPADAAFAVLEDELTDGTYVHAAGTPGGHVYKAVGHNSAGDGAESLELVVTVAAAQAA
jgi:hypothetical protein